MIYNDQSFSFRLGVFSIEHEHGIDVGAKKNLVTKSLYNQSEQKKPHTHTKKKNLSACTNHGTLRCDSRSHQVSHLSAKNRNL